jgi:DNA-directed RNA polymerase subunit beta'
VPTRRGTAVTREINGIVKIGEIVKSYRKVAITSDDGEMREYLLPRNVHINVQDGERVKAGDPLMNGPRNPHDILPVLGEKNVLDDLVLRR